MSGAVRALDGAVEFAKPHGEDLDGWLASVRVGARSLAPGARSPAVAGFVPVD
jgi:hypothetical protein